VDQNADASHPGDDLIKNIRFASGILCVAQPVSHKYPYGWPVWAHKAIPLALCRGWQEGHVMARLLQKDDWLVYAAFLPALLASGGIGATAAMAWHAQKAWHLPSENAACIQADADDYVRGLAKRGIATLPGYNFRQRRNSGFQRLQ
jgi:hypothetical protein